jgi:hypothetical protein
MAIADEGALAHVMLIAARQGAAQGTAVVTWAVVEGEFEFEAHLACYCKPTFHKRKRNRLVGLEKRYKFKREVETFVRGVTTTVEKDFWHREVWTENEHIVYVDALVGDGSEPSWQEDDVAQHNLGRVPAVWIKNIDHGDASDIDGVSLLEGLADMVEDTDRTLSQKSRAVRYNQDPERIYVGMDEQQFKKIAVGGGASTVLPPGGKAELLEMKGEGQRTAEEHVVAQRARILETSRVVIPDPERLQAAARSGVALRMLFAPTLELVGELRQTYGRGLRELLTQILNAARTGRLQDIGSLETPPPPNLAEGKVKLQWGNFFDATPEDLNTVAQAAVALKNGQVLDLETIIREIAGYWGIKDVAHAHKLVEQEAEENACSEYGPLGAMPRSRRAKPPNANAPVRSEENDSGEENDGDVTEGGVV